MASFLAKRAVMGAAKIVGCSDETAEKLGSIAKWTTAITAGDVVGLIADRAVTKYYEHTENRDYERECDPHLERTYSYVSDGDEEEEVVRELRFIQPFTEMAMEAYKNTNMAEKFPLIVSRSQLISSTSTDTQVHVCILKDGSLAFVFRGTLPTLRHPSSDFITDIMQQQLHVEHYDASDHIAYTAPPSIKSHKGFQLAFRDVTITPRPNQNLRLVAEGLDMEAHKVKRVVCVGHSLGGALATLCAHWCRYVAYPHVEVCCITMGSPRVGNLAFAKDFNENVAKGTSYRLVNKGDVVPTLPSLLTHPNIHSAYKHVGGLISFYTEHCLTSTDTILVKHGGRRPYAIPSIFDHHYLAYVNSLDKVLANFSRYYS